MDAFKREARKYIDGSGHRDQNSSKKIKVLVNDKEESMPENYLCLRQWTSVLASGNPYALGLKTGVFLSIKAQQKQAS